MEVTKSQEPTQGAKEEQKPELDSALTDEPLKGYQQPEDLMGWKVLAINQTGLRPDSGCRDDLLSGP